MNCRYTLLLFIMLCYIGWVEAQPADVVELDLITDDLNQPVDIVSAGDERLFIVEKEGRIQILRPGGQVNEEPFLDIAGRVNANGGERGLLGLAFHPDYANNGYFYVNYTGGNGESRIARFTRSGQDPDLADPDSEKRLLTVDQPFSNHNAGDLTFGPDGYLYFGLGDGGSGGDPIDAGQDRQNLLGKILRIDVDNGDPYAIPPDNPFAMDDETLDEIWLLGLRNPWRISFDRLTGDFYIGDVGQSAFEEINRIPTSSDGGENLGWRCYEGFTTFNTQGCPGEGSFTDPYFAYPHVGNSCTGSVTGGFVYRGTDFPIFQGFYFFAEFCRGKIYAIPTDGVDNSNPEQYVVLEGERGQYVTFGEDHRGELYLAAIDGRIFRVGPPNVSNTSNLAGRDAGLEVLPNPFRSNFQIRTEKAFSQNAGYVIFDMQGRLIGQGVWPGGNRLSVDSQSWPAGVYQFSLRTPTETRTVRIVKH